MKYHSIIIILACLALSACSGRIIGKVYVDENSNGLPDDGEKGVAYAKVTVLYGNERIGSGLTNRDGEFRAKTRRQGRYCISLDSATLGRAVGNLTPAKAIDTIYPGANLSAPIPDEYQNDQITDEGDDTQCVDINHDGDCDGESNRAPSAPAAPPEWTQSGYCFSRGEFDTEVNVPVRIDYDGANANASSPPVAECKAGDTCEVSIALPRGCELKPLDLPDGLLMAGIRRNVSGSADPANTDTESNAGSSSPVIVPKTDQMAVTLSVDGSIPIGETNETINPSAHCGRQDIVLTPVAIKMTRTVSASVNLNLAGTPMAGRDIDVDVTVENTGEGAITGGELKVEIPAGMTITRVHRSCRNLGNKMLCPVNRIASGMQTQSDVTIRIPDDPDADTVFTINAAFSSDELEEAATAEPIEFSISG